MTTEPFCPFRAVGYTAKAADYPLSESACRIIAEHNGVPVGKLPLGARHAPNPAMLKWLEALGRAKDEGQVVRHPNGAWKTMAELEG